MAEREYVFGQSFEEVQRQLRFATLTDLPMRRLLEDAGIVPGMRVLDLGSGAGNVALLSAELVGEAGSVVGVDLNPASLEAARERARAAGYHNINFVEGNLDQDLVLDGEFDAVVGRFVLTYMHSPADAVRSVLPYLRSGGIIAFQETNQTVPAPQDLAFPPSPLYARMQGWKIQAFAKTGTEVVMGLKLHQTFLDAGLPEPQLRAHSRLWNGSRSARGLPDLLRELRPVLLQHGITTQEELDASIEQLYTEFAAERKVAVFLLLVDAWARKP